jgi:hypothetical protein
LVVRGLITYGSLTYVIDERQKSVFEVGGHLLARAEESFTLNVRQAPKIVTIVPDGVGYLVCNIGRRRMSDETWWLFAGFLN